MKHTQYDIKQINHRVRSGGLYWKQYRMQNQNAGHRQSDIWYFVSEAKTTAPRWLITNTNLAKLLYVSANNLASYAAVCNDTHFTKHDDTPVDFVFEDGKPIKRTRQLLWTIEGVYFILNKSGIRLVSSVKEDIQLWLKAQAQTYGVYTPPEPLVTDKQITANYNIKSLSEASSNIVEAVKYVTDIVNQLWTERNKRRELEDEITRLNAQILNLNDKKLNPVPREQQLTLPLKPKLNLNATDKLDSIRATYHRHLGENNNLQLSMNQYLASNGTPQKADQLTKIGLLNSDQVYSLFSEFWKQDNGKIISKDKFQAILRKVFHSSNSTHRTPVLKANMLMDNMAIVCQVFCKKKPNPRDTSGNILEADNPAYSASPEPCVRFQTRYTSKAIDYLRVHWYKLRDGTAKPVTA